MHTALYLLAGFLVASLLATLMASDIGEQMKNGWASLWCGQPKMPVLDVSGAPYGEENGGRSYCENRVLDTTGGMLSVGLSLAFIYALFWMWTSMGKKNTNNYNRMNAPRGGYNLMTNFL